VLLQAGLWLFLSVGHLFLNSGIFGRILQRLLVPLRTFRLIRTLEKIELLLHRCAALMVSVTHSCKIELVERGVPTEMIAVILNGVGCHSIFHKRKMTR